MKFDIRDVSSLDGLLERYPELERIKSLFAYASFHHPDLPCDAVDIVKFVIYFYSHDSDINDKKNHLPIDERKLKACKVLNIDALTKQGNIRKTINDKLFYLMEDSIFRMVFDFLVFQNKPIWTEICVMEQEVLDFQKIRMAPVQASETKDIIAASQKKDALMTGVQNRLGKLQKYKEQFYGDFEDVREKILETLIIEDYAKNLTTFF